MSLVRLADWPRHPYLNDELREWIGLHLQALGVSDVAIFATATGREEDERRLLVATELGLLDTWYGPRTSSARYSLSVRLYPWQAVHGVDLRGETSRLWAHEHETRWRLQIGRPSLDVLSETAELGRALAQFAAVCAVMAEPAGQAAEEPVAPPVSTPPAPGPSRPPIRIEPELQGDLQGEPPLDFERRLGLPPRS
jgi:hypothetical protein